MFSAMARSRTAPPSGPIIAIHWLRIRVPSAHPTDEVQHLLGVPRPEVETRERLRGIAAPGQDVVVHVEALGHGGFDPEYREPHPRHQELQHSMLELEELSGPVGGL